MTEVIVITDEATRAEIAKAIAALRVKQDRMPAHWHDRRQVIADEIDDLVDDWIAAEA